MLDRRSALTTFTILTLTLLSAFFFPTSTITTTEEPATMLDPKTFPRPPSLSRIQKHILIKWPGPAGSIIAETRNASWVLETFHPPTYYIPRSDVKAELRKTARSTFCEWKGAATYWAVKDGSGNEVENRIWSYESPSARFEGIKGDLCFYVGPWECFVDGEKSEFCLCCLKRVIC